MAPDQRRNSDESEESDVVVSLGLVIKDEGGAVSEEVARARGTAIAEACSKVLAHRIARGGAELIGDGTPDLLEGFEVRFADPIAAVKDILRYLADIEKMRGGGKPTPVRGRRFSHHFGMAYGADAIVRARAWRAEAPDDAMRVAPEIWEAVEGRLDVEARGEMGEADAVTLVATKIGTTFRYMPWTTPGRRKFGLILTAILVVATVVGLTVFGPPPK
jgi:hypothetical protein